MAICLLLAAMTLPAAASPPPVVESAWERLARFEFNAVAEELGARPVTDRELRLALAVATLNRQPRTPGLVSAATESLERLVAESGSDDPGRWARFFLGRIAQLHRVPAEPTASADRFRALISEAPSHPAAQRAVMKLALLLVYDADVEPDRTRGFAAAEALLPLVANDAGRAELRLLLGRAAVFFRLPAAVASEHLQAALAAGVQTPFLRAATLYAVGEFAREGGDRALALASYRSFIAENPRDQRVKLVRDHLAALEQTTAAR